DQMHVEAPLEERPHAGLEADWIEEIRHDDGEPGLARAHRVAGERVVQPGRADGPDPGEKIHESGELVAPAARREAFGQSITEHPDADALEVHESDEPERCRESHRIVELRRATEAHRR